MDQLVAMISERTGLSEAQAREVATMVVTYIKGQLPEPVAAQIDGFLGGQGTGDVAQQAMSALGGLFGKQQ